MMRPKSYKLAQHKVYWLLMLSSTHIATKSYTTIMVDIPEAF